MAEGFRRGISFLWVERDSAIQAGSLSRVAK